MTPSFIAAILAGFEETLDNIPKRLDEGDLRREVEAMQAHIAGKQQELEAMDDAANPIPGETPCSAN